MNTAVMSGWYSELSPPAKARLAGLLYVFSVASAVLGEFLFPGKLGVLAVIVPVACYVAVTLLLYSLFRRVNRNVALLALGFGLAGLTLEALQWQRRGVNVAMVFHGFYCLLIGYLAFRSGLAPRILGALMAFAGFVWLTYLSPPFANYVSPYNTAIGLIGEAALMLWLLVMGVRVEGRHEHAKAAGQQL
jgi:hypothetical protein